MSQVTESEEGTELVTKESAAAEPVEQLDHDQFDPTGTAGLIILYAIILALMWVLMYFVEFLGDPTIIG